MFHFKFPREATICMTASNFWGENHATNLAAIHGAIQLARLIRGLGTRLLNKLHKSKGAAVRALGKHKLLASYSATT